MRGIKVEVFTSDKGHMVEFETENVRLSADGIDLEDLEEFGKDVLRHCGYTFPGDEESEYDDDEDEVSTDIDPDDAPDYDNDY